MKIKDFSKATKLEEDNEEVGSPGYLPPEKLIKPMILSSNDKHDIFSAGVILFMMITGRPPF